MEADRVVSVTSPLGVCSGYVIGPRLVLTSGHGVPERGRSVSVTALTDDEICTATVLWRGNPGGRDDAALIMVTDAAWRPRSGAVRWGRLVTNEPATPSETWGFPDWQQRPGRQLESWQVSGKLNPGSGYRADRYELTLEGHPPDPGNPWAGMSGAALFCGDLLTGVITADQRRGGHGHLAAAPAYVLFEDDEWRRLLTVHGVPEFVLEPAELAGLAEPVASPKRTPAALLVARNQVVSFRSRHDLMNRLDTFSEGNQFAAFVLHGPGGQGKTRVAHELERRLARRRWATVWLRCDVSEEELKILGAVTVPLLIIVDYAETSSNKVAAAVRECARLSSDTPVRMLLLARSVGDWWDSLRSANPQAEELLADAVVERLPELENDPVGRIEAYRAALADLAFALNRLPGEQDRDWQRITYELRARADDVGAGVSALTLHMTALADLLDAASPRSASPAGHPVEERLINHERRYWIRAVDENKPLSNLSGETILDVLAAAMLILPDDRADADRLLLALPTLESTDARNSARRLLAQLYPATDGRPWAGLQPDRLLERFVGNRLSNDPRLVDPMIDNASPAQLERMLTVYARAARGPLLASALTGLCVRHSERLAVPAIHVATRVENPAPLITALRSIGHASATSHDALVTMADNLPHSSHCLADWAVELEQRIVAALRRTTATSDACLPHLARELDRLSSRLVQAGMPGDAMAANDEACDLYRRLAEAEPDAYSADLASCLTNRSERLAQFNNLMEALAAAQEATDICQRLAARKPHDFMAAHARSLMHLGRRWQSLGNIDEALSQTSQAVEIHRRMASVQPGRHLPDLAASLHSMSGQLAARGRLEQALAAIREAVEIRQRLADDLPDAHLIDLASALEDLADHQAALGQIAEAIVSGEVAVGIFERFAGERPGTYLSDLARSLHRLALRRVNAGELEQALTPAVLSVGAYRRLTKAQVLPHRLDFASALKNLADLYHHFDLPDATAPALEALGMYRALATRHPTAYLPQLAACLNNLAVMLGVDGRNAKSAEIAREAVALRRQLAAGRPGSYGAGLVRSLTVLAVAESNLHNFEDGEQALAEARWITTAVAPQQVLPPQAEAWFANLEAQLAATRQRAARGLYVGRASIVTAPRRRLFELPANTTTETT